MQEQKSVDSTMKLGNFKTLGVVCLFCRWEQLQWNVVVIIISHTHLWTWLDSIVHCEIEMNVLVSIQCISCVVLVLVEFLSASSWAKTRPGLHYNIENLLIVY